MRTSQGEERTYHIVGSLEVTAHAGHVSDDSPMGQALIGKRVGDEVEVATPMGIVKLVITGIVH
ncbi:MAG: GreA/GreB family elongation factor [Actinobacteria bacterium]|nr:GreA/GreB family elongation factor [Actinomycetota bacterium]